MTSHAPSIVHVSDSVPTVDESSGTSAYSLIESADSRTIATRAQQTKAMAHVIRRLHDKCGGGELQIVMRETGDNDGGIDVLVKVKQATKCESRDC